MECFIIVGDYLSRLPGQDGIDPSPWWELLQPFTTVKDLFLEPKIEPHIALVLQELVGGIVLELFPCRISFWKNCSHLDPSAKALSIDVGTPVATTTLVRDNDYILIGLFLQAR